MNDSDRYEITIEPDTSFALFGDRPCLRVKIWDRKSSAYVAHSERTKHRDEAEAEELAARLIAEWETYRSEVTL